MSKMRKGYTLKRQKLKISLIKWRDTTSHHDWQMKAEAAKASCEVFYSAGEVVGKTQNTVRIRAVMGKTAANDVWAIPRGCIVDIIPVGEVEVDFEDNP